MNGPTDFIGLLDRLLAGGVEFILVGGVAGNVHGSARATYDIDVVYRRSPDNLVRLVETVAPLRPYLRGAPPEEPFDLVFLDPPYDSGGSELSTVLTALGDARWLRDDATVVIEQSAASGPIALPEGWLIGWERGYGDTLVVLAGRP